MHKFILDKNSRHIEIGDILKVYHFTGARRKRYFMYKQVMGFQPFGQNNFYQVSHLNMKNMDENDSNYSLQLDGKKHDNIEIVQSAIGDFEEREKVKLNNNNEG